MYYVLTLAAITASTYHNYNGYVRRTLQFIWNDLCVLRTCWASLGGFGFRNWLLGKRISVYYHTRLYGSNIELATLSLPVGVINGGKGKVWNCKLPHHPYIKYCLMNQSNVVIKLIVSVIRILMMMFEIGNILYEIF